MRRLLSLLAGAAALTLAAQAPAAHAHGGLEVGSPGPGDTSAAGSTVVALRFDVIAGDRGAFVAVLDAEERPLPVGPAVVVDDRLVCAATAPLEPGVHTIEYAVTDDDGHPQQARYTFEVTNDGDPVDPDACAEQDLPAPGEAMTLAEQQEAAEEPVDLRLVLGVGVVVAAAAALFARRLLRDRRAV